MPLPIAPAGIQSETLMQFAGVNLRRDRLSLADEDCARAINADFHTRPGMAVLRGGQQYANGALYGESLAWIGRHLGALFLATSTKVFHESTVIVEGLDPSGIIFETGRGLTDPTEWLYIANRLGMQKYSPTTVIAPNVVSWTIAPPSTPLTVSEATGTLAIDLTGTYSFMYTYVRKENGFLAAESSPSPASDAITVVDHNIDLSDITDSTDPQVTHKRIYRTQNGGGLFLLDQEILAGTTTGLSSNIDAFLGAEVSFLHDPPPIGTWCTAFQGSMWVLGNPAAPNLLYYSETGLPESFPPFNYLAVEQSSDALLSMTRMLGFLGVFTARTKYRITGNTTSGFIYTEAPSTRGIVTPTAFCHAESGVGFIAHDGLFLTSFLDTDQPLHAMIEPLWFGETIHEYAPIDFSQPTALAVAYWKARYYMSYAATDGTRMVAVYSLATGKWYFYQYGESVSQFFSDTEIGVLLAGTHTGRLTQLELPGVGDASGTPMLSLEPATRFMQDPTTRKSFTHFRADVDGGSGTIALELLIDDVVRYRGTLAGARRRQFQRLPNYCEGYTWRARFTMAGPSTGAIVAITMYAKPFQPGN